MSITINFLQRKTTKEKVWKALNVIVALATVLNISGAAVWFQPPVAEAADSGFVSPTTNIADTGGDNDGYESNPTSAYSNGSGNASNANGASDRHRFSGFSFPDLTGQTINGIEVRLDWWLDSTSGTNSQSVELSWDGGTTWSEMKNTSNEPTSEATSTLGSSSDTWGRSWSATDFSAANFVARVTSNSTSTSRDFNLDWIAVKVHYTPTPVPPTITPNPVLGQSCGLDIALVVDRSGSMDSTESGQLETALRNFSLAFDGTPTVFSLSSFSTDSALNNAFSRTPQQMGAVSGDIDDLITGAGDGNTNWDSGLQRGNATFDPRPAKSNLLVIATDGSPNRWGYPTANPTFDWNLGLQNAIPTANAIKTAGTRIVVVGIGEDGSDPATPAEKLEKMKMISGSTVATTPAAITTATDVIKVTDFSGIGASLAAFADELCGGKILVQKQFDTNGDGQADILGNVADPLLGGWTFDVNGAPSNPAAQVTTNTGALEFNVDAGTYSVVETLKANTQLVSATCNQVNQVVNLGTRTVSNLVMPDAGTINCTFVNGYATGSLKVTKVVSSGTALPHEFGFRLVGSNGAYTYPANGQNFVVLNNLQPGAYSVEETGPNGYHQTNTTCTNVQVVAGQQATCTVTNARDTGTLIVKKILVNDNGGNAVVTDFGFKVNGGSTITFEADAQNDMTVVAGTYSVVENPATGYTTTYNNCSNVVIANGGTATCTITNNDVAPTITLSKVVINNNGGNAGVNDFGLTVGGVAVTSGQVKAVNANTPIALNEAGLTGYTFVSLTGNAKCPQVLNGTVSLNEGENISCTITNDDVAPTVTLNKVVINNNGGNAGVNDFGLTVGGAAVTSGQVKAVSANTPIALNEAGLTGYTFVSITGDAKCPAVLNGTVTLNEGENVVCTITNDDVAPTITLIKNVINNNGGTADVNAFGLTVGGNAVTSGQVVAVNANTPIALNEAGLFGYSFVSLTGAGCPTQLGGTVTLNEGQNVTCAITNDDIAPQLTVYKIVINNDGGTAVSSDFTLNVNATNPTPSQFAGSAVGTIVTLNQGAYEVTEEYFPGYSPAFSTDCVGSISVGQSKSCFVTNTDDTPHLIVIKHVINNNGGTNVAGDFTMNVSGTDVSDSSFPGDEAGTTVSLDAGSYDVTESGPSGYAASYSDDCKGSIALGQTKICTVTNNDITAELTVIKHVINNNGGNNDADDFTMQVNGGNVSDNEFPGDEAGTTVTLDAGNYSVGEISLPGYTGTFSADCAGTIAVGQKKTCTVTNNDEGATIALSKFVVNNNGGTADVNAFGLTVGGNAVTSGQVVAVNANTPIALNEAGLFGYSFVSLTGDAKCPAALNGTVTLNEGEHVSCTITNNDIAPELTVMKHVVNDNGGNNVAGDFTMHVTGTNVSDNEFAGDEAGTTVTLNQGAYSVDEAAFANYSKSLGQDCVGSIAVGEKKTCTITNNDIAASLNVIKDGPLTVQAGQQITYTINWEVIGPGFAENAKLVDTLPSNVTFDSASDNSATPTYDSNTRTVTWDLGTLTASSGSETITVNTTDPEYNGTLVHNTVDFTSEDDEDSDDHDTTILSDFEVSIDKVAPATVESGAQMTYTLNWSVAGNSPIDSLVITDELPANTTFVSASNDGTELNGTVTWNLGAQNADANGSVTVTVAVANLILDGTIITNTGEVCATSELNVPDGQSLTVDGETGNTKCDDDTTTTEVNSDFTVNVVKTDNIDPVLAGGQVTYTLAWTTTGNAPINNLVITDPIPANLPFVSASNGGTLNAGVVTWNLGAKNPGDFGSVTLTLQAASPIANGTVVTNIATVCGTMFTSQEQTVQHCDDDDETTTISSTPSISITKSNNVAGFTNPGKTVTYTVIVTNAANATDTANAVIMTDVLPTGFTFADTGLATKSFNLGNIAPGASVTTTYVVNISAGQLAGIYTNTASAQGSNTGKVSATSNVEVRVPEILGSSTSPELTITKKANPTVTNPGKIVSYTVVVKNVGDADVENVVVTDTLPKGFTFVDGGKATKTWKLGTLEVNHERVLNYQVKVGEDVRAGKYTNVAVVTADGMAEEARATVEVKVPKVLGLATTGASARDYTFFVLGLSMIALGGLWLSRQRRSNETLA